MNPTRDLVVVFVRGKRLIQTPAPEVLRPLGIEQPLLNGVHAAHEIRRTGAMRDAGGDEFSFCTSGCALSQVLIDSTSSGNAPS